MANDCPPSLPVKALPLVSPSISGTAHVGGGVGGVVGWGVWVHVCVCLRPVHLWRKLGHMVDKKVQY